MSESDMLIIKVPASTANLGPGFDSIGMALNLYLTLEVEKADKWQVIPLTKEMSTFPSDESNFIIQMAMKTAEKYQKELPPAKVKVNSEIPLARGLGSSAAAIVAGIELADSLCDLQLSQQEKFEMAADIEGHPDNAGASLFGGLIIGCQTEESVDVVMFDDLDLDIVAVVPQEELLTKKARGVLPTEISFQQAVTAGAVSNVLVASLLKGDYSLAGKMMKKDRYHQPYRRELVPHMDIIEEKAPEYGAFGVALSGAGPTILCLVEPGSAETVIEGLKQWLPDMDYLSLKIDQTGSKVFSMTGI
ncbi:homoserine kinase [Bacillus sp. V3B]|uniref:homoserine kinase n=1 Tax=Bacillus sp. V3B TaxID=2804915 RepID=UPI00210ACCDE|nr:homoserine kinase [Bacillus sp. V3B]MCQ6276540.1 homoserine kinase [Bacillus sp. V3B]